MPPSPKKAKKSPQAQDFIKGWPHPSLLQTPHLRKSLQESWEKSLENSGEYLNYGDAKNGAYMLGHPDTRKALAKFLTNNYGKDVDWNTIMTTSGSSMGTDLALRMHCKAGDIAVVESPTYFLAFTMMKDRGITNLLDVPLEPDGMDLVALEKLLKENGGKIKVVYTVPVHHNPTGITMSNEKREKLVKLAQEYDFFILADEAYQLLSFEDPGVSPMFYHDDPANPKVFSIGTLSKLVGPGLKVGWVHAHPALLKKLPDIGFIDSGNNPVIFTAGVMQHFIESGNLQKHIDEVCAELGAKCKVMCNKLRDIGLDFVEPKGGYFVWVQSKDGKMTGKDGKPMTVGRDKFLDYMRLCFAWLTKEQIEEGIEFIR